MNSSVPAVASRRVWHFALLSFVAVVVLVFLLPEGLFLSAPGTDLTGQFIAWRAFAIDSIHAGHFPLWNPYTYGGQPFLGDFQSAELYPPNVIFLFLPLARAVNLSFLLHLWILGWGMAYWGSRRGWHPLACALAGFTLALSGPVFPHLYGGHLSNLSSLAWSPWVLALLESAWHNPARKPLLLAAACVTLQILGGHVQYAFYTGVAAGLFAIVQSFGEPKLFRRALPMVAVVYAGAALLVAAQLLPGLAAVGESVRQGKLDFDFVSMFSFPLENSLTMVAPWFFGDMTTETYWGRAYLWEVSAFMGVTGVVLAAFAVGDREQGRVARKDLVVAALLFLLALGAHTPLLRFLYDYVPGFGLFRSLTKFTFPMMLFMVLALGAGADAVVRGRIERKTFAFSTLAAGGLIVATGIFLLVAPESIGALRSFISNSHESYMGMPGFPAQPALAALGTSAGQALLLAGVLMILVGGSLCGVRRWPKLCWVPLGLLPLEMLCFAWSSLGTSTWADVVPKMVVSYLAKTPGDFRVLDAERTNNGYLLGAPDVWGNDPTVLRRYAEFITFAQGKDPNRATQYANFHFLPHYFSLIRFRMAIMHTGGANYSITDNPGALPHALLVQNYQVLPGRDAIFAEIAKPDFDPRQKIFLETEPPVRPQPATTVGTVKIADLSSDALEIETDTPVPAILLITDLYSRDWQARALSDSAQKSYTIQPGDYILRAIPLNAGHHHLVVEYNPLSFHLGLVVSVVAWLGWLGCWFWPWRRVQASA